MGFSYVGRKLCCDYCSAFGGVRKMRCPFGCCPSVAACATCRKTKKEHFSKTYHRDTLGCEARMLEFAKEDAYRAALLAEGKFLRIAAYGPEGDIKVWFRNVTGAEKVLMMPSAVYHAIHASTLATIEDFERVAGHALTAAEGM